MKSHYSLGELRRRALVIAIALTSAFVGEIRADELDEIRPFVQQYCSQCHGAEEPSGDLRLDQLGKLGSVTFQSMYEQLADGLMPPSDEMQPTSEERQKLIRHVLQLAQNDSVVTSTGFRRLNKREYKNTVRDLLGLDKGIFDPSEYIYDDEIDEGFDTSAESLVISNELLMEYMEAADKSLRHALFTSSTKRPSPKLHLVAVGKMKGVGGSRYINPGKGHIICRSGGKAMVYDGQSTRTMKLPGRYKISVTAAAVDRDTYAVRFAPQKGPLLLGFGVKRDGEASVSTQAQLVKTFALKENVDQEFQFDVWIDKDYFPYFSFVNGSSKPITQVRANIRRRKIDSSESKRPYHGPGIRISKFLIEGPFIDEWPPESIRTTYDLEEIPNLSNASTRVDVILLFAQRAFRRKVERNEIEPYVDFLNKQYEQSQNWHESTIKTFAAMMSSVEFLYIREETGQLDSYELANRLSYLFWSTMPDAELFRLAKSGRLADPKVLTRQVDRLLKDERSVRFCDGFSDQWLSLDELGTMPPDSKTKEFRTYYSDNLETAMREETLRFVRNVLYANRSVQDFIDADYSFVNRGLAKLYGLSEVNFKAAKLGPSSAQNSEFRRVTFPLESKRGGLLGHGSILTLTANGVETSPVERGVWVLSDLFGTPPPPPPKEVPAITPDLNGAETVRDLLEAHRSDSACMECHRRIDPLGFALEAYDPIGRLRTRYSKSQAISTAGNYLGKEFGDIDELKEILVDDLRPFTRNLVIRIAEYAKGRKLIAADYPAVEEILSASEADGYRLQDIVKRIATSKLMAQR